MTEMTLPQIDQMLNTMCPMHLRVSATGHVLNAGPSLAKFGDTVPQLGTRLLEGLQVLRPRAITSMAMLNAAAGAKLHLQMRQGHRTRFKGTYSPLPDGDGGILNLSLGIGVIEAVANYDLTASDFAHTDLAIEMLYLVETKNAVMAESKNLNARLQAAMEIAEEQAYADALTGLTNRRGLDHVLGGLIIKGEDFALMQIDLDRFKAVNDTMGHAAGDHVLEVVAKIFKTVTRTEDIVCRVGGDEFTILFKGLLDPERIQDIAERLIAGVEAPIPFQSHLCRISASSGTTLSTYYTRPEAGQMLADADSALYRSKETGRARHTIYVTEKVVRQAEWRKSTAEK
jgi:diguanylate cyclase (GGDEF)-like protein